MNFRTILFISTLAANTAAQAAVIEAKVDQIKTYPTGKIIIDFDKKVCGEEDYASVPGNAVGKDGILSLATAALLADKTVVVNIGESCTVDSFNVKK